jgi:Icc-related predicted phosphoesterase
VRDAILEKHPLLVVCGHIHASAGQQAHIGITPVINAGPDGIEWELQRPL